MVRTDGTGSLARQLAANESGVSTLQYGVILALVALGSLSALKSMGGAAKDDFNKVGNTVSANRVNANPFAGAPGQADIGITAEATPNPLPTESSSSTSSGGAFEPSAVQMAPTK